MLLIVKLSCEIVQLALTVPSCDRFDPDILLGYEVQMRSWGYLLQRAAAIGVDLCQQLSRVPGKISGSGGHLHGGHHMSSGVSVS